MTQNTTNVPQTDPNKAQTNTAHMNQPNIQATLDQGLIQASQSTEHPNNQNPLVQPSANTAHPQPIQHTNVPHATMPHTNIQHPKVQNVPNVPNVPNVQAGIVPGSFENLGFHMGGFENEQVDKSGISQGLNMLSGYPISAEMHQQTQVDNNTPVNNNKLMIETPDLTNQGRRQSGTASPVSLLNSGSGDVSAELSDKRARFTAKHTTNRHHFKEKYERKRKVNVRACDLCAVRKVRCDAQRPCSHCVQNNLTCTLLRTRKKSGPKGSNRIDKNNLDLIGNLDEIIDDSLPKENVVAMAKSRSPETEDKIEYKLTPANLLENVHLIGEEPIIFELLKPLTVQLLIMNYRELEDFLQTNFEGTAQGRDINLMLQHDNSLYLLTLLVVLTVNLIVAEILIKLKKQRFKDFIKYSKRNLMVRNFKTFKNLAHLKIIEIFSLVEKNFIVPPIVSPNNSNNSNINHLSSPKVYYNLSLGCLHLCNYYHSLNLNNTLNNTSNLDNNYGNEMQEHQKIVNLQRSILYFQLINLKNTDSAVVVQLCELFENLVTFETFYLVYLSNNYNLNITRNNDIVVQLLLKRLSRTLLQTMNNSFNPNMLFLLMRIIREEAETSDIISRLTRYSNFNVLMGNSRESDTYYRIKDKLMALTNQEAIFDLIRLILVFKLLLTHPLDAFGNRLEVFSLMKLANSTLDTANLDLFKLQMSNYQLLQPLLHLLKISLDIKHIQRGNEPVLFRPMHGPVTFVDERDDIQEIMIRYSDNLIKHFPFFNNINKLIRSSEKLNEWFLKLNDNRQKLRENTSGASTSPPESLGVQYHDLPTPLQNANVPYVENAPIQPVQGSYSDILQLSTDNVGHGYTFPVSESVNNLFNMFSMEGFDASNDNTNTYRADDR